MNFNALISKPSWMMALLSSSFLCAAEPVTVITQFTNDNNGFEISVAADNDNNALAVFSDAGAIFGAYAQDGLGYGPSILLSDGIGFKSQPDVAMDATGTGLAIWVGTTMAGSTIETAFFNNGVWTTPPPFPLDTTTASFNHPSVSMNGFGTGLAAWADTDSLTVVSSFFFGGTWIGQTTLGTGANGVETAYSSSGKAAVVWSRFDLGINDIHANTFTGTTWQGDIILDAAGTSFPKVGIDANGNAIAIWTSGIGLDNVVARRFDATTSIWGPAVPLSVAPGNVQGSQNIAVAPDGTAIAVWVDASGNVQMNLFNGVTWSAPIFIAPGSSPNVTMDSVGNALIGWVDNTNNLIFNALFPKGGTLQAPFILTDTATQAQKLSLALSSNANTGYNVWTEGGSEGQNSFGSATIYAPAPPIEIRLKVCRNTFAMQNEHINIITFTPSLDPNVVAYNLRRNGVLIAVIPATGPFKFKDHCRGKHDVYSLTSVNEQGVESDPIIVESSC